MQQLLIIGELTGLPAVTRVVRLSSQSMKLKQDTTIRVHQFGVRSLVAIRVIHHGKNAIVPVVNLSIQSIKPKPNING